LARLPVKASRRSHATRSAAIAQYKRPGVVASPFPSRPASAVYIERMSEIKITALENGPLEVDGACAVLTSDGTVVKESTKVFLCRCGHSAKKPVCDGSHKREGFIAS